MNSDSLMHIGVHCSLENCKQLDFLPFQCSACHYVYCLEHRLPNSHNCKKWSDVDKYLPVCPKCQKALVIDEQNQQEIYKKHLDSGCTQYISNHKNTKIMCNFENCGIEELLATYCKNCKKNFCLKHRYPSDHKCSEIDRLKNETDNKKKEIMTLLNNNIKKTDKSAPSSIKKKRIKKLNPKIELIKMKSKAKGDSSIAMKSRKYFRVYFPLNDKKEPNNMPMFFDESWSIGKVLDKAASYGNIINKNDLNDPMTKLNIYSTTSEKKFEMSKTLNEYIKTLKELDDGGSIIIERGDADTIDINNYL